MKQVFSFKSLFTVLLLSSLVSATYSKVLAVSKVNNSVYLVAQAKSAYDQYMQSGYAEAQKRKYRNALSFFKQAEQARSGDRYATRAISNVTNYINRNRPPSLAFIVGNPSRTRAAATRTLGSCFKQEQSPIPLMPSEETLLTTAEYPSLFFYVPQIQQAKELELVILDESKFETLQKVSLNPSGKAGIVRVNLTSKTGKPLEQKKYTWSFSVICNFQEREKNLYLQGSVKRVLPDENLTVDLETAAPQERIEIYVKNKYWEDALRTLIDLRLQKPNDTEVRKYWEELLQSVKLEQLVINAPLL